MSGENEKEKRGFAVMDPEKAKSARKLGGHRGGTKRSENLSDARKTAIARKAARARWSRKHDDQESLFP